MKVAIALDVEETRQISFQDPFPETTECCRCGGTSRLAFVAHETDEEPKAIRVCHLKVNKPNEMWLHDSCCVAVYLCKCCLEPTALYNQA